MTEELESDNISDPMICDEETGLLTDKSKKNYDTAILACVGLIRFGDAIEINLPGIITQQVQCELDISKLQEGNLDTLTYLSITVAIVVAYFISERFGRKTTCLFSLYIGIASTIFCSIVPNYYTLLLSRCLIGFSIGINDTVISVYFAEVISTKKGYLFGAFVQSLSFALGGLWTGLLGYFFLERLGWRIFISIASIPVFILAMIILHFFLVESHDPKSANSVPAENSKYIKWGIVIKISVLFFIMMYQSLGIIILLPSILRDYNIAQGLGNTISTGNCFAVNGTQFLVIAAVFGCNSVARIIGYNTFKLMSFRKYMILTTLMSLVAYIVMMFYNNIVVLEISLGVVQLFTSMQLVILYVLHTDIELFGVGAFNMSATVLSVFFYLGEYIGNCIPAFLTPYTAISSSLVLAVIQIFNIMTIHEVKYE